MADKITQIPAPRVPFVDAQTGLVNREWYRFLYNLYTLTGDGTSGISIVDLAIAPVAQPTETTIILPDGNEKTDLGPPPYVPPAPAQDPEPRAELGTFAGLQQANLPWTTFARNPGPYPLTTPGTVYWDNEDRSKTLAVVMEDSGDIVQDIGEETFYRVKASAAITKGQVVMFTGSVGASGGLRGAPATGLTAAQAEYIMGVATQNIALNGWGYVTWFGEIKGVNTLGVSDGGWVDGQVLYYNPAVTGGLTKTRPSVPNPIVFVAAVVHAASNGILFVRPTYDEGTGEIVTSPPYIKTANFTVVDGDTWLINNKAASTCVVTLPSAATHIGRTLTFQNWQPQLLVSASNNVIALGGAAASTQWTVLSSNGTPYVVTNSVLSSNGTSYAVPATATSSTGVSYTITGAQSIILLAEIGNWATLVSNGTNWVIMQAAANNCLLIE